MNFSDSRIQQKNRLQRKEPKHDITIINIGIELKNISITKMTDLPE